ncbi:hypothetical protein VRRI112168_02450 [Vreelandella rituensis]|uniref:Uncharacterized protein n=1 Tax=Vreelandella rituensis TaxID=2282306 RepID=A0A368U9J6_9GAMM|nr:hypothetical protein [Halomonas rituensis]RCV93604.1 hypothetical protein DU506_00170 [Halomonas rituensis]
MSRYDWEAGTIKIPTRAWVPLKKVLRETHNAQRERVHKLAEQVQPRLAAEFKGKRDTHESAVRFFTFDLAEKLCREESVADLAAELVLESLKEGSAWQTRKITQAMLDTCVGPKATNKTLHYSGGEWDISLDDTARTVHWDVHENNRAVEAARESLMGHTLFKELNRIDYGKQKAMGGVIVGNDEYNQDDCGLGGGGNYETASFGKAGEREGRWHYLT